MLKKPSVRIALVLSVLIMAGIVALAAGHNKIILTQDGRMSIATQPPSHITPWIEPPSGLSVLAGNLSQYPYGVYFCCYGYNISGPNSFLNDTIWVAVPFTPTADATVVALEASVGWGKSGTNGVTLSLNNNDVNDLPGSVIAAEDLTGLADSGECCVLAVAKDPAGIAVTAGKTYWLVVGTSNATENTYDVWAMNSTDMRTYHSAIYDASLGGWGYLVGLMPGYAILGHYNNEH